MSEIPGLYGNFWPSVRERDLLRFLLHVDDEESLAAWARWRPGWDPDAPGSEEYRFYPLMAERLAALSIDEPQLGMLQGVRRQYTVRNMMQLDQLEDVLAALAGIDTVVLKGAALVLSVYRNTGLRPFHDLDVLVDPQRHHDALRLLRSDGWEALYDYDPGLWDHATSLRRRETNLDVHRRYSRELVIPGHLDLSWDLAESVTAPRPLRSGRAVRILAPTDSLLHTLAHGTFARGPVNLRWLADAKEILASNPIDWDRLVRLAIAFEVGPVIHDAFVFFRDTTGVPVPAAALESLRTAHLPLLARRRLAAFHTFRPTGGPLRRVPLEVDRYLELTRHLPGGEVLRNAPRYAVLEFTWPRVRARLRPHRVPRVNDAGA